MPVNGVRVLPDIPKNMPNMEILIREFETGFHSMSTNCQHTGSKSSTLSDGNFVKKIVEAYESSVRTSNENSQRERTREKSDSSDTLDVVKNRKNVEKNGSEPATYDASSQCRNNFKKKSKIFLTPIKTCEIDEFVILNRYHSKSDVKTVSETRSGFPSNRKINMYSPIDELSTNGQFSPLKRIQAWNLKKKNEKLEDITKKNKLMICSSPLEDVEDKDLDCEDALDDILTSSCDSSSNNSYRNLQADLYSFEDEQWQLELSSTSLSSSKSSLGSSHNNMLSINDDRSLLQDLSFQDVTVTSPKDIPEDRENFRNSELPNPSFNFDRKSPKTIGSLNEDRPIKTDNDTYVTWISALGEKLSRKKPLQKLLKSAFNTKLLNYKKIWKNSAGKQLNERTSDSGFIERFLSSSSSSSQKSWHSDPSEKPPTFGTFGRIKNTCVSDKFLSKSSRMVLTEVPRKEFTNNSKLFDSIPWISSPGTTNFCKENAVESSLKSTILTSSPKLKASCGYPPLSKHPYLTRNGIPKHPFIAKTKLDQEESEEEKEMKCDAKERESDTELESSGMSSQAELNISYSKMSEWLTSSPNNNCDLLRSSRSCKSTSALDGLVPQQIPVDNNFMLCNFSTNFLSTMHNDPQRDSCTHRYATVSPKNLRFSMSREKSRAIERNFDA